MLRCYNFAFKESCSCERCSISEWLVARKGTDSSVAFFNLHLSVSLYKILIDRGNKCDEHVRNDKR